MNIASNGTSRFRLSEMTSGWFVGSFKPAAFSTADVEVAVQHFSAGYRGLNHYHKLATETTLLLSGEAMMGSNYLVAGDILVIAPGVSLSFEAIQDCVTVVVKHPGALNDKYFKDN